MVGIYKITNPQGKVYIGQSVNIPMRWVSHRSRKGRVGKGKLQCSFRKHGHENHTFEIVECCLVNDLNNRERHYQVLYDTLGDNGLNMLLTTLKPRFTKEMTLQEEVVYLSKLIINEPITIDQKLEYRRQISQLRLSIKEEGFKAKLSRKLE